ncbi:hypothetical protein ABW19_dt0200872 [Dactylella cylindrospora]|nr:hypothetical protein ABW19_dt0200872 [Dactylella cylindrospora]
MKATLILKTISAVTGILGAALPKPEPDPQSNKWTQKPGIYMVYCFHQRFRVQLLHANPVSCARKCDCDNRGKMIANWADGCSERFRRICAI